MKLALAPLALAAIVLAPQVAFAQPPPPPPPAVATETTTEQATGPSWMMVGSGIVVFGLAFVPATIVGTESSLGADRNLFVPLVGPWLDFANRPGCSGDCNTENTNKVLLAVDGVAQGAGALIVLGGLLTTGHETKTVQQAGQGPTVHVTPANVGSGYGMVAVGSF
jgi:hypothetical protein